MTVKAPAYEASVASDGCLTSLRVGGREFFRSTAGNPRGAYLYQKRALRLGDVHADGSQVTARGDVASVRFAFGGDAISWEVTNLTDDRLLCLIVFDKTVNAVADEHGVFEKTPVRYPWRTTTWFRDGRKLHIAGGSRVWGPWGEGYQVWEARMEPKETREIVMTPGEASEEEQKAAEQAVAYVAEPPTDPDGPMWDMETLSKPPKTYPAEGFEAKGVRALFYDGLPYRGRPTRVFAWVGMPEVKAGEKAPGMVLVHGGGGTAFDNWVRLWTERGYAAIAMDTCGCTPGGDHGNRPRHAFGGPPGWGGWNQIDWPRTDQWTYHAVADAILAHSLLRSLPEVDPDRIGLTGISWGGYLTCILAGIDHRFRFAAPVYGCGFLNEHGQAGSLSTLSQEGQKRWMRWWDASVYLPEAPMPMLWVTGSNDFAYTLNSLQKSYRLPKGSRDLCIRLRMPHGHPPGEAPEEIHLFADSILGDGEPLPRIIDRGREGVRVWATFESTRTIVKAELNYTLDTGKWQDRKWERAPADLDVPAGKVTAALPEGAKVYYLNLIADGELVVSTEHEELPAP